MMPTSVIDAGDPVSPQDAPEAVIGHGCDYAHTPARPLRRSQQDRLVKRNCIPREPAQYERFNSGSSSIGVSIPV